MARMMDNFVLTRVLFDVFSRYAREWATLLLTFALFAYAAWKPELYRIVTATVFALICHIPLWVGSRRAQKATPSEARHPAEAG